MKFRILVVEDEKNIQEIVGKYLEKAGYEVALASDGFEGLDQMASFEPNLVVLDVMMPGIDGFEVLREIRNLGEIPVIMLTARHTEDDKIDGFDFGADDYITKPFSPKELVRRVEAVIRRSYHSQIQHDTLNFGPFKLDLSNKMLYKNKQLIKLTAKEFQIMEVFMNNIGIVLTREQIIEKAFGQLYEGYDRAIDSQIKKIRHKIENDTRKPEYLKTRYGSGYVMGGQE
jgi:DNA-binding response OmpR family regulator